MGAIKTTIKTAALAALGLTAAGCASLSREECLTADWRAIGFADGVEGRQTSYIDEHRKACADVGVTPSFEAWSMGYEDGLVRYCEPANGLRVGLEGRTYRGVCTGEQGAEFVAAYRAAYDLFDADSDLERARRDLSSAERDRRRARNRLRDLEDRASDLNLTQEQRDDAASKIPGVARDLGRAEGEIVSLRRLERTLEEDVFRLRIDLERRYPGVVTTAPWRRY